MNESVTYWFMQKVALLVSAVMRMQVSSKARQYILQPVHKKMLKKRDGGGKDVRQKIS
jgi:hypothetical protein